MTVRWDAPAGLTCELGQFGAQLSFSAGDGEELSRLLNRLESLIADFPRTADRIRQEVLDNFANARECLADWAFEEYERDATGEITETSILAHTSPGTFHLSAPESDPEGAI